MSQNISTQNGELVTILNKKKYWYHSIRWKILFSFLLISCVLLFFIFLTLTTSMKDHFRQDWEKKLLSSTNIIATNIAKSNYLYNDMLRPIFDEYLSAKSKEGSYRIMVLDTQGMVVNDTNKAGIGKTYVIPEVIEALKRNNIVTTRDREQAAYAAVSIIDDTSEKVGAVLIVSSVADTYQALSEIQNKLVVSTLVMTCVMGVMVFFVSKLFVEPLNDILKAVQRMSEGHLKQRVVVKGHDEFSEVAEAFNDMTEKLEQVEKTREEFVSNVSHELKTPLSSIKVLTESILLQENAPIEMYTEFLQDINSEVDRMTNIVKDLLNLVKLDQGAIGLNIRSIDLNKVCEDIFKRLNPLAEYKDIKLIYENMRKVVIDADEMKISLAISNLVENGIKYTPPGGTVKIIVDSDHQNTFITIQDTGLGIEEKYHDKIFSRFYRVDKTRDRETGGTGLGLAITRSTVLLHNGSIRLISKENEGTTFVVRLPLHYNTSP